jgi:hypothetical protein
MDTYAFDTLMDVKTTELLAIYDEKINKTPKNKKVISDPSTLDFHSKKLIQQINAAYDKKLKNSAAYKKRCAEELANDTVSS